MKIARTLLNIALLLIVANFGTEESTVESCKKPSINIYGTLSVHDNDKQYAVENVLLDKLYKKIEIYDLPGNLDQKTFILAEDPIQGVKTFINLSEISQMQVPNPQNTWTYQKDKNDRAMKYIEITITSNCTPATANTYLISADKKIECEEVSTSLKKDVPIRSIKLLKIDGFKHRDSKEKQCAKKKNSKLDTDNTKSA